MRPRLALIAAFLTLLLPGAVAAQSDGLMTKSDRDSEVLLSPSGRLALVWSVRGGTLWDTVAGQALRPLEKFRCEGFQPAFFPGERRLASCDGTVFDVATGKPLFRYQHWSPGGSFGFADGGRQVALIQEHEAFLMPSDQRSEPLENQRLRGLDEDNSQVMAGALTSDGRRLVLFHDDNLTLYDVVARRRAAGPVAADGRIFGRAVSGDGAVAAMVTLDGTLTAVATADGAQLLRQKVSEPAVTVAVSPDGRLVAYGTERGEVGVVDRQDGRVIAGDRRHADVIRSLSFGGSAETGLLLASSDRSGNVQLRRMPAPQTAAADAARESPYVAFLKATPSGVPVLPLEAVLDDRLLAFLTCRLSSPTLAWHEEVAALRARQAQQVGASGFEQRRIEAQQAEERQSLDRALAARCDAKVTAPLFQARAHFPLDDRTSTWVHWYDIDFNGDRLDFNNRGQGGGADLTTTNFELAKDIYLVDKRLQVRIHKASVGLQYDSPNLPRLAEAEKEQLWLQAPPWRGSKKGVGQKELDGRVFFSIGTSFEADYRDRNSQATLWLYTEAYDLLGRLRPFDAFKPYGRNNPGYLRPETYVYYKAP